MLFLSRLCKVNSAKQKSCQSRLIVKPDNLDSLHAAVQSHVISPVTRGYKIVE